MLRFSTSTIPGFQDNIIDLQHTDDEKRLLEVLTEILANEPDVDRGTLSIKDWLCRIRQVADARIPLGKDQQLALERYAMANSDMLMNIHDMTCLYLATEPSQPDSPFSKPLVVEKSSHSQSPQPSRLQLIRSTSKTDLTKHTNDDFSQDQQNKGHARDLRLRQERIDELEAYVRTLEMSNESKRKAHQLVKEKEAELAQLQHVLQEMKQVRDEAMEDREKSRTAAQQAEQHLDAAQRDLDRMKNQMHLHNEKLKKSEDSNDQYRAALEKLRHEHDAITMKTTLVNSPATISLIAKYKMDAEDEIFLLSLDEQIQDAVKKMQVLHEMETLVSSQWWKQLYLIFKGYPETRFQVWTLVLLMSVAVFFFLPMPFYRQFNDAFDPYGRYHTCPVTPFQRMVRWLADTLLFDSNVPLIYPS
ncbi:hypothetical protein DM01DRAFT_1336615 [Hesseltinella vesiculosa]|uniref:Uncharacterized protein n=1 Tax=Hesseltinella vesiculosa TaxID=101127 RepID=A0A1X2GG35_9FUNG|nr:hypothetical protein DM01DRAFT_1336615 [Hesseltinella vesiculosa]